MVSQADASSQTTDFEETLDRNSVALIAISDLISQARRNSVRRPIRRQPDFFCFFAG
jgi:hypothetical protein